MSQAIGSLMDTEQIACSVYQQAITLLLKWAEAEIPSDCHIAQHQAIQRAQKLLDWGTAEIGSLQLVFDQIKLKQGKSAVHYISLQPLEDCDPPVPYPSTIPPTAAEIEDYKQTLRRDLLPHITSNWNNFSWLAIALDKYGGCVSYGDSSVALIDLTRIVAAVAVATTDTSDVEQISLIAGDLSGIQKFIYTITSSGALKSLRARSFYLELVTEEVIQQLLAALNLPRSSVIYAGGGNLYLLAPSGVEQQVREQADIINQWLQKDFQSKVFLSLACQTCATQDVASVAFTETWNQVIQKVNQQKTAKFSHELNQILQPRRSHAPCKVCHRDDEPNLQLLNPLDEADSVSACSTCRAMFRLGGKLLEAKKFIRSRKDHLSKDPICLKLESGNIYYHVFENQKNIDLKEDTLYLINNWNIADYQRPNTIPLLLGNYGKRSEQENEEGKTGFMTASEFAEKSVGIQRVGYLRMDVDRLGRIFAEGLGERYSLPKLAGLSRQMSYFFKVYLNSLADNRQTNFLNRCDTDQFNDQFKALRNKSRDNRDKKHLRQNLLFIYAGGDDLFVSGAWDEIVEFAFDIYQAFRAYTGNHPDITLSGGVSLEVPKFPLYQAANSAGEAEDQAKANDRDSLGLFGAAFKWSEWLGTVSLEELDISTKGYLQSSDRPPFLGIWDFVRVLLQFQLSNATQRSFVRNLLLTAQIQEQQIEEKQRAIERHRNAFLNAENDAEIKTLQQEEQDIRYYLHLPKIAYTLARLPSELRQKDEFKPIRISLLSPYNAPYFRAIATWIELLTRKSES